MVSWKAPYNQLNEGKKNPQVCYLWSCTIFRYLSKRTVAALQLHYGIALKDSDEKKPSQWAEWEKCTLLFILLRMRNNQRFRSIVIHGLRPAVCLDGQLVTKILQIDTQFEHICVPSEGLLATGTAKCPICPQDYLMYVQNALFIIMLFLNAPNVPSLTKGFISQQMKCGNGSILMELISPTMVFLTEPQM